MKPPDASPTAIPFVHRDARQGFLWLRRAYAMFRAAPLAWLFLLLTYVTFVAFAELGPWLWLKLAASVLKPVFTVGFLAAAWSQERGGKPALGDLFRGFRSNLWALLPLGVVFFIGITLAVSATALVDGGALIAWFSDGEKPSEDLLRSGRPQLAALFGAACALPTVLACWFAPALVVFHDAGALSALRTSLRAALANWRPVTVFAVAALFYGSALPLAGAAIAGLLGESLGPIVAIGLVLPYMLVFLATFQIADYVAYRDVFHPDEPPAVA